MAQSSMVVCQPKYLYCISSERLTLHVATLLVHVGRSIFLLAVLFLTLSVLRGSTSQHGMIYSVYSYAIFELAEHPYLIILPSLLQ